MFAERDLSACDGENSVTKPSKPVLERFKETLNSDDKTNADLDGFTIKSKKTTGNSSAQELTLSYLCENPNGIDGAVNGAGAGAGAGGSANYRSKGKGKEVLIADEEADKWVERDFLNLNNSVYLLSKREADDDSKEHSKKQKLETLNLSLALPDVSLSLAAQEKNNNEGGQQQQQQSVSLARARPARSVQSLTQTTCSNDFTAASLSYSYSHPFSHNPSCSLENCDYSVGRDDQIWCGEGTNGSVHSRFKPIGDGVGLLAGGGGGMGNRNKDLGNSSFYRTTSSDNNSFFPSELPARPPRNETQSVDSKGKGSDQVRGLEDVDAGKGKRLSRPEKILRDIVSESVTVVSMIIQELPDEIVETVKEYLRSLIRVPEKKEELVGFQNRLKKRSDLTNETLAKCHKDQLDILVAVKTGLDVFVSNKIRLPKNELLEIFLSVRCRNVNCKSLLPVDDCDCKICTSNEGFCSSCMCPVCLNFDCANNTCSWVGCDVCSHWCHAACGIQRNLIKPGPSLKGPTGTTEMQFHCIGCDHASEMFGFVKDVFVCCAKDWGGDTLMKELDCVRKIFRGSEDYKGKELHQQAEEMLRKLEGKMVSSSDACRFMIQFFNSADSMSDFPTSAVSSKSLTATQANLRKDAFPLPDSSLLRPKQSLYSPSTSNLQRDLLSTDLRRTDLKASLMSALASESDILLGKPSSKDDFDSLESIIRIKEAEARMFQSKADEARREAEGYRQIIRAKTEKLEEEYADKLSKLCLQETEERRRKKLEELKVLENSHCDYYSMKMRMQAEIAGLLERMEATRQKLV